MKFPLTQQIRLKRPDVLLIEPVGRFPKALRELFDRLDVALNSSRRVAAPLEFLQHRSSEMGHRCLLVTHTLLDRSWKLRWRIAKPPADAEPTSVYLGQLSWPECPLNNTNTVAGLHS